MSKVSLPEVALSQEAIVCGAKEPQVLGRVAPSFSKRNYVINCKYVFRGRRFAARLAAMRFAAGRLV